jgi:hypothetical protein
MLRNLSMTVEDSRRALIQAVQGNCPEDNGAGRTTTETTSVSPHLLGNDNGCIWRHRFHPADSRVEPFKSGWLNVPRNEALST